MSNAPYDREAWNVRERPISEDNNYEATYADLALRETLFYLFNNRTSASNDAAVSNPPTSFFGESFKVRPGGALSVRLVKGIGMFGDVANQPATIGGLVGVNDLSPVKPLVLTQDEYITVPPNATANPRIDIIEVRYRTALIDPINRDIMTGIAPFVFVPGLVNKTLTWKLNGEQGTVTTPAPSTAFIGYKVGTPAASPVAPSVTVGYEKIAEVNVAAGAVTIFASNINDYRRTYSPYGVMRAEMIVQTNPATATHTLIAWHAPPGVEAPTLTDAGTTTTDVNFEVEVPWGKRGQNPVVTHTADTDTLIGTSVLISKTQGGAITLPNGNLGFIINVRVLAATPTYGVGSMAGLVNTRIVLSWSYS